MKQINNNNSENIISRLKRKRREIIPAERSYLRTYFLLLKAQFICLLASLPVGYKHPGVSMTTKIRFQAISAGMAVMLCNTIASGILLFLLEQILKRSKSPKSNPAVIENIWRTVMLVLEILTLLALLHAL